MVGNESRTYDQRKTNKGRDVTLSEHLIVLNLFRFRKAEGLQGMVAGWFWYWMHFVWVFLAIKYIQVILMLQVGISIYAEFTIFLNFD